jgi:CubicO group peptidase (beta-lactamase class C family)
MKETLILAVALTVLFLNSPALAQSSKTESPEDIERRIERVVNGLLPSSAFRNQNRYAPKATLKERMAYYHTPGVSIAVVNNYKVEWARGFGVREQGKRDPVTETTLFQAASISKPIFALAVMRLVEDGKLNLDEDVNRYLKSWKVPANGDWQPRITLRQILSHSAGLTVHGFPGYRTTEKIPSIVEILSGEPPSNTPRVEVNLLPGLQARYSGGGTMLAGLAVTDVLGKPFAQFMRELVFDPVGMKNSTFEQPLPANRAKSAATAHPYKGQPLEGKWHVYPELAPDGLWTTPSDLARVGVELQRTLKGEGKSFLSSATVSQMLTPVVENVGIGFMINGKENSLRFGHGGWNEGFVSQMTMYKDNGMGAVIMVNSNEGEGILREIERAIAREYGWPEGLTEERKAVKVSTEALDVLIGEYGGETGFKCTITRENDRLFLKPTTQPAIELFAESDTKFFAKVLNAELTFEKGDGGEVKELTLQQENKRTSAQRKR